MSTLTERPAAVRAWHQGGKVFVELADGRVVKFPVAANARLRGGTPDQLNRIEISPYGLHWPELDEDLSTAGLLSGRHGQHLRPRRGARRRPGGCARREALQAA